MFLLAGLMGLMAASATAIYTAEAEAEEPQDGTGASGREAGGEDADSDERGPDLLLDPAETGVFQPEQLKAPTGQILTGDAGDDTLTGTGGADHLGGDGGDDSLTAGDGTDRAFGGSGQDTLNSGAGADTLHGGAGDDWLQGGAGADDLYGHGGDDLLRGGSGADSLVGSAGDDTLHGDDGDDAVHGYLGNDSLTGGAGADTLFGGWGDDTLGAWSDEDRAEASPQRDYLNGGAGDDLIHPGQADLVTTGEGADTVVLGPGTDEVPATEILDFAPEEDRLVVVYDDCAGAVPQITIEPDEDAPARQHLLLDGMRIAAIGDAPGLTLDHVVLLARSALPVADAP